MISLIIPTYNEKNNIEPTLKRVVPILESLDDYEIIFVDDNSPDKTYKEILKQKQKNPKIKLIKREKKDGIGSAYLTGFENSKGDIIINIDADLSQDPKHFPDFVQKLKDYDMVIGSRYVKGGCFKNPNLIKKLGSRVTNLLSLIVLGLNVKDASHSFRAFKREVYEKIKNNIISKGHPSFFVEFTYKIQKKFKIYEIPVIFVERKENSSNLNLVKAFFDYIKILIKLRFQNLKLG